MVLAAFRAAVAGLRAAPAAIRAAPTAGRAFPWVRAGVGVGAGTALAGSGILVGSGVGQAASQGGVSGALFGNDNPGQGTDFLLLALVALVILAVVMLK